MKRSSLLFLVFYLLMITATLAQSESSVPNIKRNHYSFAIGLGWTHYINTLEIGKDQAKINSPGLSLRFFWEPEHRLSLGLETGFYRLYKVSSQTYTDLKGSVTMAAMPLMLTVRMRVVDHLYLSTGAGLAVMFNKVSGIDKQINSTILSMSNYQFSASYIYPLSKHWQLGGEFKFYNFGKTADWLYGLQVFCAVRL
jgi:hypothetical protein